MHRAVRRWPQMEQTVVTVAAMVAEVRMFCRHMGVTEEHQAEVEVGVHIMAVSLETVVTEAVEKLEFIHGR